MYSQTVNYLYNYFTQGHYYRSKISCQVCKRCTGSGLKYFYTQNGCYIISYLLLQGQVCFHCKNNQIICQITDQINKLSFFYVSEALRITILCLLLHKTRNQQSVFPPKKKWTLFAMWNQCFVVHLITDYGKGNTSATNCIFLLTPFSICYQARLHNCEPDFQLS